MHQADKGSNNTIITTIIPTKRVCQPCSNHLKPKVPVLMTKKVSD